MGDALVEGDAGVLAPDDVLDRPAPKHVTDLGESAVEVAVFFWVHHPARAEVYRIRSDYVQAAK